jgi:hypothetical protein
VNSSKQSAMMILDMLNSIKHPLHYINHTATKLRKQSDHVEEKVGGDPSQPLPARPSQPKPSQSSGREAKVFHADESSTKREMQLGKVDCFFCLIRCRRHLFFFHYWLTGTVLFFLTNQSFILSFFFFFASKALSSSTSSWRAACVWDKSCCRGLRTRIVGPVSW